MYSDHFGFAELPFSISPDARFWYANSLYREAFATLRYGIETRKGFIVITGEAGTGKTTLLRRFMQSARGSVHTAFIFNTHRSFTDLLRLALNDLGLPSSSHDRLTLMAQLNTYLFNRLDQGHIVSLLVDEAQNLSNEMLEELRLLSNLETDRAKLIQIVLIGQPELESKLEQPELRQLKQRVAIRCRLVPLKSNEVAPYIHSRLQTVGYQGEPLFDLESIRHIARYSKGIPRLINVICDNALLIAYANSQRKVSAEIIHEVARDLQLSGPSQPRTAEPPGASAPVPDRNEAERRRPNFDEFPAPVGDLPARRPHRRTSAGVGIGILLAVLVLTGTILYTQQLGSLAAFGFNIEDLVGARWKNSASVTPPAEQIERVAPREEKATDRELSYEPPVLNQADVSTLHPASAPEPKIHEPARPSTPQPEPTNRNAEEIGIGQAKTEAKNLNSVQEPLSSERLELEIYKAIHNRAIRGVEVSVVDGVIYLAGRVATRNQKFAAVQAAASVPGAKGVRDEIVVDY
ncbi:MAG: AAA family ATPase [Candidatus Binatia bacterium]